MNNNDQLENSFAVNHIHYKRRILNLFVYIILFISIIGISVYYLITQTTVEKKKSGKNQVNQIENNTTAQNPRFLYVIAEQRRANKDPRNWGSDHYTLISYDPVSNKKIVIYETNAEQLLKESGSQETCCVSPKIYRYGENKIVIFGPKNFKAKVIDINNGTEQNTFIKNNSIFTITTDENYLAYSTFRENDNQNLIIRNLESNQEQNITLDDIFKGKERYTEGLYLAPDSQWDNHNVLFKIYDTYLLSPNLHRDYWDSMGQSPVFQYNADSGNIKQMSANDSTSNFKDLNTDTGFQFGPKIEYDKWIIEAQVYPIDCTPQYLRIINKNSGTTIDLGTSITLCADEKEVKRTAGTIVAFDIVGWFSNIPQPTSELIQTKGQIPLEESLIKKILNAIQTESKFTTISASFNPSDTLWWIAPDNWNILVKEGKGLNINIPYDEDSTLLSPAEFPPFIQLHQFAKEYMQKNGLAFDSKNSSKSITDDTYYDYIQAYQGNSILCVAVTNGDIAGDDSTQFKTVYNFRIDCANKKQFQSNYTEQIPFLKALNLKYQIISNIKIKDNLAYLNIHGRRAGSLAILYKSNSEWKEIYHGNGTIECSELVQKKVSKELWVDCFDKNDQMVKGNVSFNP